MENTAYLRRQALFCLRLSQLCPDDPLADHLRRKAAEYHEKALRTEFEAEVEPRAVAAAIEPALNRARRQPTVTILNRSVTVSEWRAKLVNPTPS